jgi:GNAT superfamily N-acetyltransferase
VSATIRQASALDLPAACALWVRLDTFHQSLGLDTPSRADAAALWAASFERTLGRFSFLWVAEHEGRIVGLALSRLKQAPAVHGGGLIGEVSDLYVDDSMRGQGLGARLASAALDGLRAGGAGFVEVQVVAGNDSAVKFWESQGLRVRLQQLGRPL